MSKITVKELQEELNKLVQVKIIRPKKLSPDLEKALDVFKSIVVDIEPAKQVKGSQDRAEAYNNVVEFYNINVHPLRPDDEKGEGEEEEEPAEEEEEEEVTEEPEEEEEPAEEEEEPEPKKPAKGKATMKPKKLATGKATKAPAKKAAGNGGGRGRNPAFEDSAKITVLNKVNPYREGSTRWQYHQILLKAKSVGGAMKAAEAAEMDGFSNTIRRAIDKECISLS